MYLARFFRAIMFRPVPIAPVIPLRGGKYNRRERALTVKLDLDTADAKAKVQELIDMAKEAQAIIAKVRGH